MDTVNTRAYGITKRSDYSRFYVTGYSMNTGSTTTYASVHIFDKSGTVQNTISVENPAGNSYAFKKASFYYNS